VVDVQRRGGAFWSKMLDYGDRPLVVSLDAFMVASVPKNQKASPSPLASTIGTDGCVAGSDISVSSLELVLT